MILGASSGFGEATALALAKAGWNILGVHLDRKSTIANVERIAAEIKGAGRKAEFFNVNAADAEKRSEVLNRAKDLLGPGESIQVLFHSLAFGTLKPFVPENAKDALDSKQMDMTLDVMAHSLVYWTQDVIWRGLMTRGGRIYAMTSAGSSKIWLSYGAVSAAKCALESHIRQLAVELAPKGITANALLAGVTDTPALRKIPGNERMIETVLARNPSGRLTTPNDIAQAVAVFARAETQWMTGNTIRIDGAENIVD